MREQEQHKSIGLQLTVLFLAFICCCPLVYTLSSYFLFLISKQQGCGELTLIPILSQQSFAYLAVMTFSFRSWASWKVSFWVEPEQRMGLRWIGPWRFYDYVNLTKTIWLCWYFLSKYTLGEVSTSVRRRVGICGNKLNSLFTPFPFYLSTPRKIVFAKWQGGGRSGAGELRTLLHH